MFARSTLIAAAVALGAGSAAMAEPTKAPRPESAEQRAPDAPVLMASADVDHAAAAAAVVAASATDGAAAPAKRPRRGRVTTCRCADTPNQ
jgi:hypothetical protein